MKRRANKNPAKGIRIARFSSSMRQACRGGNGAPRTNGRQAGQDRPTGTCYGTYHGSHCIQVLNRVNNQSRAGCDQQHIRRHPHVTIARSWNPKLTDQVGRQRMIDHALRQWVSYSPFCLPWRHAAIVLFSQSRWAMSALEARGKIIMHGKPLPLVKPAHGIAVSRAPRAFALVPFLPLVMPILACFMIAARISRNRRGNKIHGESNSQREQLQSEIIHGSAEKDGFLMIILTASLRLTGATHPTTAGFLDLIPRKSSSRWKSAHRNPPAALSTWENHARPTDAPCENDFA